MILSCLHVNKVQNLDRCIRQMTSSKFEGSLLNLELVLKKRTANAFATFGERECVQKPGLNLSRTVDVFYLPINFFLHPHSIYSNFAYQTYAFAVTKAKSVQKHIGVQTTECACAVQRTGEFQQNLQRLRYAILFNTLRKNFAELIQNGA